MSVTQYNGKTAQQLSNIESGSTKILSKAYWESNAYTQLSEIFDRVNKDTYATDFTTIQSAIDSLGLQLLNT